MAEGLVKSAARALEILELFATERRRLSLTQIGALVPWPKSSLAVLLKSLEAQGYLAFRPTDMSYFPTLRVTALGDWIAPVLIGAAALPMLEALRDRTGETVTLTVASGTGMRVLKALPGTFPISLQLDEETVFPLFGTAVGSAWLAALPAKARDDLFRRAARDGHAAPERLEAARAMVADARARGYAAAFDMVVPDAGALALPLTLAGGDEVGVLAVAGLSARIRAREPALAEALRAAAGDAAVLPAAPAEGDATVGLAARPG